MANFVADTFTGSNGTSLASHTGETGATWTLRDGTTASTLDTNRLKAPAAESWYHASGSPGSAEYDVTADLYVIAGATAGDAAVLGRVDTGANTFYLAQYNSGSTAWRLFKRVAGSYTQLGTFSQAISADTTYALKLEIRDAAKKVYIDGVERISSADNAITAAGKAGLRFDGTVGIDIRIDNFVAADTLTHYTLTADAGSFALTGQAATLKATRTMPAASGTFTLTGQTATLTAARLLSASSGSFSLTGQTAALRAGRVLSAASGTFALSGQAATLTAARVLSAGSGTFSLAGQSAGLYVGRVLAAGSGTFTLTGQAATLRAARTLSAGSGSFVLGGGTVTFVVSGPPTPVMPRPEPHPVYSVWYSPNGGFPS